VGIALRMAQIAQNGETAASQIGRHGAAHVTKADEAYASFEGLSHDPSRLTRR
jgi:hypothetical protein